LFGGESGCKANRGNNSYTYLAIIISCDDYKKLNISGLICATML
jgi:hypothetical protein